MASMLSNYGSNIFRNVAVRGRGFAYKSTVANPAVDDTLSKVAIDVFKNQIQRNESMVRTGELISGIRTTMGAAFGLTALMTGFLYNAIQAQGTKLEALGARLEAQGTKLEAQINEIKGGLNEVKGRLDTLENEVRGLKA